MKMYILSSRFKWGVSLIWRLRCDALSRFSGCIKNESITPKIIRKSIFHFYPSVQTNTHNCGTISERKMSEGYSLDNNFSFNDFVSTEHGIKIENSRILEFEWFHIFTWHTRNPICSLTLNIPMFFSSSLYNIQNINIIINMFYYARGAVSISHLFLFGDLFHLTSFQA